MKRFFLTIILFFSAATFSFGQEKSKIAVSKPTSELAQAKSLGKYTFTLPSGTSSESVQQNAKYYAQYFTVDYTVGTNTANITMLTNDEKSRHIICRFLFASGVEKIEVDGKTLLVEDFYTTYMK